MLTCDDYLTPGSLDEAFDMMASNRGRYRIIAGATDTLPWALLGATGMSAIGAKTCKPPGLNRISDALGNTLSVALVVGGVCQTNLQSRR